MSHSISIIHNHNLDISDVDSLAADLLKRFDVNIKYGHYAPIRNSITKLLGLPDCTETVITGELEKNSKFTWFELYNENYYENLALKHLGESIFHEKSYWGDEETLDETWIKDEILIAHTIDYGFEGYLNDEFRWICIFKHFLLNQMPGFFSDWWFLCYLFTRKYEVNIKPDDEKVFKFRNEIKSYAAKLGAEKVYLIDDQSNVLEGLGEGSIGYLTWDEIHIFIKEKCKDLILDIPEYLTNDNYRKMWLNCKAEPLAFVDNFRDFK